LVEIGSVVSEEKIFFKFHPSFFLFLSWWPSFWKSGSPDTILEGGHPRTIPAKLVAIGPVVSEEKIFM
jgi:hypothetical protein